MLLRLTSLLLRTLVVMLPKVHYVIEIVGDNLHRMRIEPVAAITADLSCAVLWQDGTVSCDRGGLQPGPAMATIHHVAVMEPCKTSSNSGSKRGLK